MGFCFLNHAALAARAAQANGASRVLILGTTLSCIHLMLETTAPDSLQPRQHVAWSCRALPG